MEYVQMTLDDWVQMKQKLRQELIGVKQSFVRIGYALRQIDDQRLYENDGYKAGWKKCCAISDGYAYRERRWGRWQLNRFYSIRKWPGQF